MRIRSLQFIISILSVLCFFTAASAQPELDISFNGTGMATATFLGQSDPGNGVVVQADNKIIVGGLYTIPSNSRTHFGLVRYNVDGSLDTTYGDGGKVMTVFDPNGIYEGARAIAIQPDGKVLAAGFVSLQPPGPGYFAIARYNTDGSLDTTFGVGGKTSAAVVNHINDLMAITVAPDGKIAACGYYFGGLQSYEAAILKLNPDGSRDTSFNGGTATYSMGFNLGDQNIPQSVAIQPDGKVVAAGSYYTSTAPANGRDIVLARFNANGMRDTTFGSFGLVKISGPLSESLNSVKILSDGKILAAGGSAGNFLLMRFNPNGTVDTSFDGDGRVTATINGNDYASSIFLRPDGRILLSGYANGGFGLIAYNANGSLDTSFSGDGKFAFWGGQIASNSLALDSLGRVVIGGSSNSNFAAARLYTLNPIPVAVSGRVVNENGMPLKGAKVTITTLSGETRTTFTSPFGYYIFGGIATGQTYNMSVFLKHFVFVPKTIGLNEERADLDFTGVEEIRGGGSKADTLETPVIKDR